MTGLIRIIILFLIGYYIFRFVRKLLKPSKPKKNVQGNAKTKSNIINKKNIEDADFEEIE